MDELLDRVGSYLGFALVYDAHRSWLEIHSIRTKAYTELRIGRLLVIKPRKGYQLIRTTFPDGSRLVFVGYLCKFSTSESLQTGKCASMFIEVKVDNAG